MQLLMGGDDQAGWCVYLGLLPHVDLGSLWLGYHECSGSHLGFFCHSGRNVMMLTTHESRLLHVFLLWNLPRG